MGAGINSCCRPDDTFGSIPSDDVHQVADESFLATASCDVSWSGRFDSSSSSCPMLSSERSDLPTKSEHALSSTAVVETMQHREKLGYGFLQTDVSLEAIQQEREALAALGTGVEQHRRASWSFADADENKRRSWIAADIQEHRRRSWTADDIVEQRSAEQAQKASQEQKRVKEKQARLAERARETKKLEEQIRSKRKVAERAMRKLKPPFDISPLLDESPDASLERLRAALSEARERGLHNILISDAELRLKNGEAMLA